LSEKPALFLTDTIFGMPPAAFACELHQRLLMVPFRVSKVFVAERHQFIKP